MDVTIFLLLPEIVLLTLVCLVLVMESFYGENNSRISYVFSQITLILVAAAIIHQFPSESRVILSGSFISDPMSALLKFSVIIITLFVFFYSNDYLIEHNWYKGEYFVLALFAVLGMMILISAASLLTIYLGLELLSLSLYAMVAMQRESTKAAEAAMKYFILGALASGMLLYGISILYGVTGSLILSDINHYISGHPDQITMLVYALVFLVVGIGFKFGAVPFHMWAPDVYQGAPTSVTLFISSAPKIAAFAMTVRLIGEGLLPLLDYWQEMLIILAVLSMAIGNIVAISQSNIKRMLAYSTIAHIGFLLLGILSTTADQASAQLGFSDAMFYVLTYAITSICAFGIIILLGRKGHEADNLDDFKGLSDRSPWFALIMLIVMFSLAGVPPFVGFWAKWYVLKEIVAAGYTPLAILAVIFSIIGAYYYLRVVKLMYFDKSEYMTAIKASQSMRYVLTINGLVLLLLGLAPGMLMSLCLRVFTLGN